ncbi:MAG: hypothetical protein WED04_03115 [Promethearchaeati archaeon SRVP18_Atabeyarchaeia-1]
MPAFRIDFYVQATLDHEVRFEEDSKRMMETLRKIQVLKNIKMSEVKSSNDKWFEFEGNIDIPQGSKAFLALLKRKDQEDPYNIFLRIDVNKESDTRERAEKETREWIESTFGQPVKGAMGIAKIKIATPLEIIKDKKGSRKSVA